MDRYTFAMKMVTSRNANGAETHFLFFVTFQHLRISDVSQIVQIRPLMNRSAQTSGLVDCGLV